MKYPIYLLLSLFVLTSCNAIGTQTVEDNTGTVQLEFPSDWTLNEGDIPFDLQMFSANKEVTTGVFVYKMENLADGSTPKSLLEFQIQDLESKRDNFREIGSENFSLEGVQITTSTYSGDKDTAKSFYRFSLLEFDANKEVIIIILQTGIPSYWPQFDNQLREIVKSTQLVNASS